MAEDSSDWGFAPPPFQAEQALEKWRRELRNLKLTERAGHFEWRGRPVLSVQLEPDHLKVRVAQRPAQHTPEWEPERQVRDHAAMRHLMSDLQKRLARWAERDD